MAGLDLTQKQLKGFQAAAQSLRLYRRADISSSDSDAELIEKLYVDPLPHEHVLETMVKPNTTFLIGRKGTGKSTVFKRLQRRIIDMKSATSAYVDIKTLYESSQVDQGLLDRLSKSHPGIAPEDLQKLLLYKNFIKIIIEEIKNELKKRAESTLWDRVKNKLSGSLDDLFDSLEELAHSVDEERFGSVLSAVSVKVVENRGARDETAQSTRFDGDIALHPSFGFGSSEGQSVQNSESKEKEFSDILIRVFNVKDFLTILKTLLSSLSIRNLYILIDDFSELPEQAMRLVVDVLLAPLNNWSDEFIKFKIAAYPGRIYYGQIDKTKIDEIFLDIYQLYGSADISTMEEKASDFTKRLVESRLQHYAGCGFDRFLNGPTDDIWRHLYFASMANPRILGHLLHYLYETQLIYNKPIGLRSIRDVSRRYYEEKIESSFAMNQFLHQALEERSSIFGLKELLESLVVKARDLKKYSSGIMEKVVGQPPTSHFHVLTSVDSMLLSLELNFFLTKYYEMSDRDGRKVSVFALNYGLCQRYIIGFGRPEGHRDFRLYYVERIFDFTPLLHQYILKNQEIICDTCNQKQTLDKLDALKIYGMRCPACQSGICQVVNLSRKYESLLKSVDKQLLLPGTELGMLHTLHAEGKPMFASDIASELDCSHQLIGWRGRNLSERGLVQRNMNAEGRRTFEISQEAEATYFKDLSETARLDVSE